MAMEIDQRLVRIARELNADDGVDVPVVLGDITAATCAGRDDGPWDLILLRDVMEHIAPLDEALALLRDALALDGMLLVVFPPYYSPYGGHQQILPRRGPRYTAWRKLPWVQLLPDLLFRKLAAGDESSSREVRRLRGVRLTLSGFEGAVRRAGLRVRCRRHYLSRPTYALRYGMPVIPAGTIGRIPWLRELVVTAGYYLVSRS